MRLEKEERNLLILTIVVIFAFICSGVETFGISNIKSILVLTLPCILLTISMFYGSRSSFIKGDKYEK